MAETTLRNLLGQKRGSGALRSMVLLGLLVLCGFVGAQTPDRVKGNQADLSRYRADVAKAVSAYKNYYPKEARQKKLEGKAVVRVDVAADGGVSCVLKTSTGHEVLDRQALGIVSAAAKTVAIPVNLKGTAFALDFAVVFSLARASEQPPGRRDAQGRPTGTQGAKSQP